jgi:Tol biopolymer transport system component
MKAILRLGTSLCGALAACAAASAQSLTRVTLSPQGTITNQSSYNPATSADGRFVAYESSAGNLVANDTNGDFDVFVYDRETGVNERVSVSTAGIEGNNDSRIPSISADGRFVAFTSVANNLVPGDTNVWNDAFVRDRLLGTTERVSIAANGAQGDQPSAASAISADGRYVVFTSLATNLVPGQLYTDWNVFVKDRVTGSVTLASVDTSGTQQHGNSTGGSISADGRYVAFQSTAELTWGIVNNSSNIFVRDLWAARTELVDVTWFGISGDSGSDLHAISADGRWVAFQSYADDLIPNAANIGPHIFLRDLVSATTTCVSVNYSGVESAYISDATVLSISADGRFVAFDSTAPDLVPNDSGTIADVFVRDALAGKTSRVSESLAGAQGNGSSYGCSLSADGRFVAFGSLANNLDGMFDPNLSMDIFLLDRGAAFAFTPLCSGDGSAGVCPCGNQGVAGHGCENSAATGGAVLTATGVASLSASTVVLTSTGELPSALSIVLQGRSLVAAAPFGDGLRCTGGNLKRLYVHNASSGTMSAPQGNDATIPARSASLGDPIALGATRLYQVYYRDADLGFCPEPNGSSFNVSNAIATAWGF